MKKFLMGLMLVLFIAPQNVLAADTWENFYDEDSSNSTVQNYTKAIKEGFTCTYENSDFSDFSNIVFQFSRNGWNVKIGSSQFTICGTDDCSRYNSAFKFNNKDFYFTSFSLNEYLDNYLKTNSCPSNIYFESDNDKIVIYSHNISTLTSFTLDNSSSTVNEPDPETGCLLADAYCEDYTLQDVDGNRVYVQLGRKDDGVNREDTKYFAVANNSSYSNYQIISFTDINRSASLTYNGITYTIPSSQISLLYPERGSFVDSNYLTLSVYDSTDTTYYLSWYNFDDPDDIRNEYDNNTDLINSDDSELDGLPIEEINFCDQNGVQKTFQIIGYLLFVAKIIVPLLLIILGTIDFAKATVSSDDKAPRDAVVALIRRIIIAVIIFFIPTILNFLLSLVNGASEAFNDNGFTGCTDCLFDPFGACEVSDIGE